VPPLTTVPLLTDASAPATDVPRVAVEEPMAVYAAADLIDVENIDSSVLSMVMVIMTTLLELELQESTAFVSQLRSSYQAFIKLVRRCADVMVL
jgi:hypothetical protein